MNTIEQRTEAEIGYVELIRRLKAGDDAGFELLVRRRAALERLLDPVTGASRE